MALILRSFESAVSCWNCALPINLCDYDFDTSFFRKSLEGSSSYAPLLNAVEVISDYEENRWRAETGWKRALLTMSKIFNCILAGVLREKNAKIILNQTWLDVFGLHRYWWNSFCCSGEINHLQSAVCIMQKSQLLSCTQSRHFNIAWK